MKKQLLLAFAFISCQISFAQFTKLVEFGDSTNGASPSGGLISDGTYLYGTTNYGGLSDDGTVYRLKPDGTSYMRLMDFDDTLFGRNPLAGLFLDGGFLYGTAYYGGAFNNGTLFRIQPDSGTKSVLLAFNGTNGAYPRGTFLSDGTRFYSTTSRGGSGLYGTTFSIMPDGTLHTLLKEFDYTLYGIDPSGGIAFDGTYIYGTTEGESIWEHGNIYRIKTDGSDYLKLFNFTDTTTGSGLGGGIILDGSYLYGITTAGGSSSNGILYKIKTDGTGYMTLHDFNGSDGAVPVGTLTMSGGVLYGATAYGGAHNNGTLFRILPDGSGFLKLMDFGAPLTGSFPGGSLYAEGNYLYGYVQAGGANNKGFVFKYEIPGCIANYTTAYDSTLNNFTLTIDTATSALAVSYLWDFGDGTTSSLAAPSHIYTVDSVYNVCMTIITSGGDTCTFCDSIGIDPSGAIIRGGGGFTLMVQQPGIVTSLSDLTDGESLLAYPNPSNGLITLKLADLQGDYTAFLEISNAYGHNIYSTKLTGSTAEIDLSAHPPGLYVIRIHRNDRTFTNKIVLVR